jgi:hypothetical protein
LGSIWCAQLPAADDHPQLGFCRVIGGPGRGRVNGLSRRTTNGFKVESRHSFWKPGNCEVRWENEPLSRQRAAADGARE